MPIELMMIPVKHAMVPATDRDAEIMKQVTGPMRFSAVKQSARSLRHHRLFFGGLLRLTFDYWEPDTGLLSPSESKIIDTLARWLDRKAGQTGAVISACDTFKGELIEARASKIETPHKSFEAMREWVTIEAGHFELVMSPTGVRKIAKSINFQSMSQEQFNEFYKAAFSVCWRFVLSRTFETEQEAENVINQLMMMG